MSIDSPCIQIIQKNHQRCQMSQYENTYAPDDLKHTLSGTLKVLFFSIFSVLISVLSCPSIFEVAMLFVSFSIFKLSCLSIELFSGLASVEALRVIVALLSKVLFFLGISVHSVISITASVRSKEMIPLLLREKCKFALIGEDRLRVEYLKRTKKAA